MGLAARPGRSVPAVHDAHGTRRTPGFAARQIGTAAPGLQPVVDLHTPFLRGSVFGVVKAELDRSTYGSARDVLR